MKEGRKEDRKEGGVLCETSNNKQAGGTYGDSGGGSGGGSGGDVYAREKFVDLLGFRKGHAALELLRGAHVPLHTNGWIAKGETDSKLRTGVQIQR
jgi:hypothetical protein